MYFLVHRSLSGICQGIQAGHAALEYAHAHKDDPRYIDFVENHKTFIVLNGGSDKELAEHKIILERLGIQFASFNEPDLNDCLTAIAFLMDECDYADPESLIREWLQGFRLA